MLLDRLGASHSVFGFSEIGRTMGPDYFHACINRAAIEDAYAPTAYAKQNNLTYTKMINKAGQTVSPTSEAFQVAAALGTEGSAPRPYIARRVAKCD
jgi:hypothetical protein